MIVKPGPDARPHFFLIGYRVPLGRVGPNAERVGVLVARDVRRFDGSAADGGKVLMEDLSYSGLPKTGPFRYESEIATDKPAPDVVVVDDLDTFLTPVQLNDTDHLADHIVAAPFGSVQVDRGAGYGAAITRHFGWLPRTENPRLALAGRKSPPPNDHSTLEGFDAKLFHLPLEYKNTFNNGQPLDLETPFATGHRLRFTNTDGTVVTTLQIPPAPVLRATLDGAPLEPPLALIPRADTVVMDRGTSEFTVVWRTTFPWAQRLEAATLEID